jgi:hypothetical protein
MSARHTAPAEACASDADRSLPYAPAPLPHWFGRFLILLLQALLRRMLDGRHGHAAWWHDRPDLPDASAQQEAAARRGAFGNAIAWMCLRRGFGPGHADWPYLARTIVAFGGSLDGFQAGLPACGLQWWEHPAVMPGMIGPDAAMPAVAMASPLTAHAAAPAPTIPPASACRTAGRAIRPHASRRAAARRGTGPPTGPPAGPSAGHRADPALPDERGRPTASPAIPIRATAIPHRHPLSRTARAIHGARCRIGRTARRRCGSAASRASRVTAQRSAGLESHRAGPASIHASLRRA